MTAQECAPKMCSIYIHNTGTGVPPDDPFALTLQCMVQPRKKKSHRPLQHFGHNSPTSFIPRILQPQHKENWLTGTTACQCLLAKNERIEKMQNGGRICIWQTSKERAANMHFSFLPPSFLRLGTRGFFVILSSLQHVSRCLKIQNQHSCGIWHKWHVEDKKKNFGGKEHIHVHTGVSGRAWSILKLCL